MTKRLLHFTSFFAILAATLAAQKVPSTSPNSDEELRFVVYLSRHGVRSPTGKPTQYNPYSAASWPDWDVPPGYLTPHGYHVMKLFGAYDRIQLASEGLIIPQGCDDDAPITFYADSDQRTRETGRALAEGILPGCNVEVKSLPEGTNDPLFHPDPNDFGVADPALATAAIAGRIGNNPASLTEAYRAQIGAMDKVLATCGVASSPPRKRISLYDVPSSLAPGEGEHLAELRGPLTTASSLAENLLLEYTQGMTAANVGWGCVNGSEIRSMIDLHTAATDFTLRTPAIARFQASNLLDHILRSLKQATLGKEVPGASSKPTDQVLFLIGHDTNLTSIGGLLSLDWIADGRRDDTPPGGALVFELWKNRKSEGYSVRMYFTVQSLEQMRSGSELTWSDPPQRVPVFLPGCSRKDLSCDWTEFESTIHRAIDPRYAESKEEFAR
jgi:4-phytase/acid phosphatase